MIGPQSISQICRIISSIILANVRSNLQTFKTSLLKYPSSHKFEYFKYAHTPYMQNSTTKKVFSAKSHLREASGLITIVGMLTICEDLSVPREFEARRELARLGLVSKHHYQP